MSLIFSIHIITRDKNLQQSPFYTKFFITIFVALSVLISSGLSVEAKTEKSNTTNKIATLGKPGGVSESKRYIGKTPNITDYQKLKRISAKSIIVIDAKTGNILHEKSADAPRQPASTIKILTGMIALQSLQAEESIPVSRKAARQPRSKIYLDSRKKYLADDLINAVLLASANDASVALAEKIAGSEQDFAQKMTQLAQSWGAQKTICKTASGLTAKGQQSTARDLATIFNHAMANKAFAKKMRKNKVTTSDGIVLYSHNKALWQVKGALGGKTGYTNKARQTYVGKFKQGEDELIVAIMGSEKMWTDVKRLVSHGFAKKLALEEPEDQSTSFNISPVAIIAASPPPQKENS